MRFKRIDLDLAALSAAELETAVYELTEGHQFFFYDPAFPSVSDPGAYVQIKKEGADYFLFRGNHGWSTGWKPETAAAILDYVLACKQTILDES